MRFIGVLVAGALLLGGSVRAAEDDAAAKSKAHYAAAVKHYNLAEYKEALARFRDAYLAVPAAVYLFNMGQCHRQLGDHEAAAQKYRAYLRERPDAPNRAEVERFLAVAEAELQRKAANVPPTGVERVEPPPAQAPAAAQPAPSPGAHASDAAVAKSPGAPKKSRWWIGMVIGAAAAVAVGAVAIGVAYAIPNDAAVPTGTAAGGTVEFR